MSKQLELGSIGYGCWRFASNTVQEADELIRTALDHGMTLIDTADIYGFGEPRGFGGAEAVLGEVLAASPELRGRMTLTTKGGIIPPRPYDSSRDYLMGALDASLTRLQVDHVELYQIHRPDLTTSMPALAETLQVMLESGKVGAIGVSNFTPSQMRALSAHLDTPLATIQPELSVLEQSPITDGTLDFAEEVGATVLAWSPLGGGRLFTETGPVQTAVATIGRKTGYTATQIALAFARSFGANVVPLVGTQRTHRIEDAAKAGQIMLPARDLYDLIEAYRGEAMP
ncbi:aryl-alcohol dehydrogenase [Algimonas ampicilliniresistens]|jgi:predicted oxidoreductase|uniref:Aryl-alcohol dehydrogenase n=1 Tax=Algimonas ampicilliniresistens TaxID=1298735 RepID=A0ABQ5V752_9PROT|nr:aldo/keto reductase [Algimonas ampicilliniresistens]GLQ22794.1 aryl-alcohol dehydrogenase [Algimonas ampicilliniresistens]